LTSLFGSQLDETQDLEAQEAQKPYETVNEDITTDTTTDGEFNETEAQPKAEAASSEQTGILSSDEEERRVERDEDEAAPTQAQAETKSIDSFGQESE
jgi:hypothetical protein